MAPLLGMGEFAAEREQLLERVRSMAATLAASAASATTLGRERAILRLIGVSGIDREGRPLAAEVVDRYVSGGQDRLAAGVGLPLPGAPLRADQHPPTPRPGVSPRR